MDSLPPNLQEEVQDFVTFLKTKVQKQQPPLAKRQFGAGNGLIIITNDFNRQV
ncbi:DUF2281 domain-containing protein [Hymenobacter sp. H14-R3]|uniref:DUF2281 domain-containing protein n=1 Tax=Hymenobacter sp. H14-R3 TaxID=3046308 RepID=UPI0032D92BCB